MPQNESFIDFNNINYLKTHPNIKIGEIWKKLIDYLNDETEIIEDNQYHYQKGYLLQQPQGIFKEITEKIDLSSDFYTDIKNSMIESLSPAINLPIQIENTINVFFNSWYNRPWNNSVAKLMWDYYFALDMAGAKLYEGEYIYINEDNTINTTYTRGSINIHGTEAKLRITDFTDADAGHSFKNENELYKIVKYVDSFELILQSVNYRENDKNKIEYFSYPLKLIFNREKYLEENPELYSEIFSINKMEEGFIQDDVLSKLTKEDTAGWSYLEIDEFIEKYLPEITPKDGDAYNFFTEKKIGNFKGIYRENYIQLKQVNRKSLWVLPWYNIDGQTYKTVRSDDLNLSIMQQGIEDDNIIANQGKYYLDFTRKYDKNNEGSKWMRLLMPQYKRRVEIEDLNRNFWVIGQTISTLMTYLFDPDGPYPKMIGGLLNEVIQIWENVLFMWAELAIQNVKQPDTITKVVYISPDNLSDYLSYDNFDFYDVWNQYNMKRSIFSYEFAEGSHIPTATNVINRIPILGRTSLEDPSGNNNAFEEIVIKYLKEYRKKFANKNVNLIPVIRLDNYENNNFSRIIIPGIYRYFINSEELYDKAQEEQWTMPIGELKEDGVFRTDTASIGNADPRSLNCYKESFLGIVSSLGSEYNYYRYDISTDGFEKVIAGIYEKASEDGYGGVNYLALSDQIRTSSLEKIYGLIKPIIKATGYGDANSFLGAEAVEIEIEAYDLAKYFIETKNEIDDDGFIKISDYIIYRQHYSEVPNATIKSPIDKSIDRNFIYSTGPTGTNFQAKVSNNINGVFGYYLGELLSKKKDSAPLNFNVIELGEKELQPTYLDYDLYRQNYGHSSEDYPEIIQDEKDDEETLINILKNIYFRWRYPNKDEFWQKIKDENNNIFEPDKTIRVGYTESDKKLVQVIKKRSEVQESDINDKYIWRKDGTDIFDEDQWKEDAYNEVNDLVNRTDMTEATILFVDGARATNWTIEKSKNATGQKMAAKDGLIHHRYPTSSTSRLTSGAAIRIPIGDGDAQYGYYPLHTNPTGPDLGWEQNGVILGLSQIWRWNNLINGQVVPTSIYNDTLGKTLNVERNLSGNEDFFAKYREYTLMYKSNDKLLPRFGLTYSSSGGGSGNYFVLRKEGADEFDETNWLIEKTHASYAEGLCYYKWRRNSTPNIQGYGLLGCTFKELDDKTPDGKIYADGSTKVYTSIESCQGNLYEYYKHTYQKYVYNEFSKMPTETLENLKLEDAYKNLNLRKKIFGWFRIIFSSGDIKNFYMPYDQPYDCSALYDPENEEDDVAEINNYDSLEMKEILKIMRSDWTFGGVIKDGKKVNNSTLNYEQLKIAFHYFGGSTLYDDNLKNCKFMGSFTKVMSGSVNAPDTIENKEKIKLYYEDRIMAYYLGNREVAQKELIYNNQSNENNIRREYIKTMEGWLKMFPDVWYDPDEPTMLKKIAKIIIPQDNNPSDLNEYTFNLYKPNPSSEEEENILTFQDQIFLTAKLWSSATIWVFGPKDENDKYVYARRGIYRYPFDVLLDINDDTAAARAVIEQLGEWGDEYYGAWPDRPIDRTVNDAHNWKDDYQVLGYDIDELRDGYEVISQTDEKNIELYKSRLTEELETAYIKAFNDIGLEVRIDELDNEIWQYPRGGQQNG